MAILADCRHPTFRRLSQEMRKAGSKAAETNSRRRRVSYASPDRAERDVRIAASANTGRLTLIWTVYSDGRPTDMLPCVEETASLRQWLVQPVT